jgi:hypothetical protein
MSRNIIFVLMYHRHELLELIYKPFLKFWRLDYDAKIWQEVAGQWLKLHVRRGEGQ